jgi:methanogenic corrinoid protein MtbC1
MSTQFLAALQEHDLQKADQLMAELLAIYTPEELVLDMFLPILNRLGHQWSEGQISVATEHLASGYLRHRMSMWLMSGPPPRQVPPLVLACAPGEWHEGSLLALGMLAKRRRWPVYYLGQSVPLPDLVPFVQQLRPALVVLVAMVEQSATALIEWPLWLPEVAHSGGPMVGYGGWVFTRYPEWRRRVPGVFLGATLQEGLDTIEKLLSAGLRT